MKRIIAVTVLAFLPLGAVADEAETEGYSLMEEGARMFLRGMMDEAEPALRELRRFVEDMEPAMREFVQEMGPALNELAEKIDDLSNYHPPEMLPNGDIILRRKVPMPTVPDAPGETGEIEL
ncbi:hypothetical protein M8756_17055 [Lutimaribacter sp. EGI FJ00015]|uniref:Uncharacterized protein n=1 Tax=Lutimaribacter degradans TaxID=2945989 RepID=A0ACC5ZZU3_9RHOB|nr:hypothetical protein [Lutimaribacter sp. EGI FJ00013]MCM2563822.1 hypothetical protein [Lutimaribacter sp. EGI FJ00013]MCO0615023.1 hypothetical protein [Lutimaribacter sp. EGI FJ00015]MCO0637687.1 hypothetical protein [Lutimaribacter sp. EGI FJ00014]